MRVASFSFSFSDSLAFSHPPLDTLEPLSSARQEGKDTPPREGLSPSSSLCHIRGFSYPKQDEGESQLAAAFPPAGFICSPSLLSSLPEEIRDFNEQPMSTPMMASLPGNDSLSDFFFPLPSP